MKQEHAQRIYFEQLKRNVPIGAVLARYNVDLKRSGNSLKGPCPLHDGTGRSFVVDENKNLFHCFSPKCGRGGDILELVSALEGGIEIKEAALLIAKWFALKPGSDVQPQRRRRSMSESKQPTHRVYSATRREGAEKDDLTIIGSGWVFNTKSGKAGMNIQLSAMPLGDRIVIFERDPEWEAKHWNKEEEPKENGNVKSFSKKK